MEMALVGLLGMLVGAGILFFYGRRQILDKEGRVAFLDGEVKRLERERYQAELDSLESKNRIQTDHLEILKKVRSEERERGYEDGLAERNHNHSVELSRLRAEHQADLARERELAGIEARDSARREYEHQTKLFSVIIKPYLRSKVDKGFIFDGRSIECGYQYQLLVNGIPAFQPHIVIESSEVVKELDEKKLEKVAAFAISSAKLAAETYLSGATGAMVRIGEIVCEGLPQPVRINSAAEA